MRSELTDHTNIALDWNLLTEGLEQGFAAVTGYKLYWDDTGSFEERIEISSAAITSYSETNVV